MPTNTQPITEVVSDVYGLNKHIGSVVYILVDDTETMTASTRKSDIDNYLKDCDILYGWDHQSNSNCIIYGLLLDPKALPYKISEEYKDAKLWLIKESPADTILDIEEMDGLESIVSWVEYYLEEDTHLTIGHFSVVLGYELEMMLQIKPHLFKITPYKVHSANA